MGRYVNMGSMNDQLERLRRLILREPEMPNTVLVNPQVHRMLTEELMGQASSELRGNADQSLVTRVMGMDVVSDPHVSDGVAYMFPHGSDGGQNINAGTIDTEVPQYNYRWGYPLGGGNSGQVRVSSGHTSAPAMDMRGLSQIVNTGERSLYGIDHERHMAIQQERAIAQADRRRYDEQLLRDRIIFDEEIPQASYPYIAHTGPLGSTDVASFGTTNEIVIAASEWAPGIWAGTEGMLVDIVRENGQQIASRRVIGVDYSERTISIDGSPIYVAPRDVLYRSVHNPRSSAIRRGNLYSIEQLERGLYVGVEAPDDYGNPFAAPPQNKLVARLYVSGYSGPTDNPRLMCKGNFEHIPRAVFTFIVDDGIELDSNYHPKNAVKIERLNR